MADITQKNIANGIDQHSASSAIKEGYSDTLENVDTNTGGYLSTRPGYEGYCGFLPVRATEFEETVDGEIRITFGDSDTVDLSPAVQGPIVVSGKLSINSDTAAGSSADDFYTGDITSQYYTTWKVDNRDLLLTGSHTIDKYVAIHKQETKNLFVGFAKATNVTGSSNYQLTPDLTTVRADYSAEIQYTYTPAGTTNESFVYVKKHDPVSGESYKESFVATTTAVIPESNHGLDNFNILVRCYDTPGFTTDIIEVIPDEVKIAADGTVTVEFGVPFTGDILLASTPRSFDGIVGASNQIVIPSPGSAWNFVDVYYLIGTTRHRVIPDDITYDADLDTLTIGYTLPSGTPAETVVVYYENATVPSNAIKVNANTNNGIYLKDINPQITVWGIDHRNIYTDEAVRGGYVNHIDSYRRSGETRIVSGLGGNLFAAKARREVGLKYSDNDPFMPGYFISMDGRTNSSISLAPLFQPNTIQTRTRGAVVDASILNNLAKITSTTYISSTEVDYGLQFDVPVTLTGKVDVGDFFTVTGLAYTQLAGEFQFVSVSNDGTTNPIVRLSNSNGMTRFNSTSTVGYMGCFTDKISMDSVPNFVSGDTLNYSSIDAVNTMVVKTTPTTTDLYVSGVTQEIPIPSGLNLKATRVTNKLYLGDIQDNKMVKNIVPGDMLIVGEHKHKQRVIDIDIVNNNVTIDDTITVTNRDIAEVDCRWMPIEAPDHKSDIAETTYVKHLASNIYTDQTTVRSTMVNDNMYFTNGEDAVMKFDGTNIYKSGLFRWQPQAFSSIDTTSGGIVPNNTSIKLEVNRQLILGTDISVGSPAVLSMVGHGYDTNDKIALVNEKDAASTLPTGIVESTEYYVVKTGDDTFTLSTTPNNANPVVTTVASSANAVHAIIQSFVSDNRFTVDNFVDVSIIGIGDRITHAQDSASYTVLKLDTEANYIYVTAPITGTAIVEEDEVTEVVAYKNYFRLNAIDANNNVIGSAATGSEDNIIELDGPSNVDFKLIGMPVWKMYDYNRIELQHYRTKGNGSIFYLVRTVLLDFDKYKGYVHLTDNVNDDLLIEEDQLSFGGELGLQSNAPIRAKYMTSVNNRLVLSNLRGYPQYDFTITKSNDTPKLLTSHLEGSTFTFDRISNVGQFDGIENRVAYEFTSVDPGVSVVDTEAVTENANGTANITFPLTLSMSAGNWLYLYHPTVGDDNDITYAGWCQVVSSVGVTGAGRIYEVSMEYKGSTIPALKVIRKPSSISITDTIPVWLGVDGNYRNRNSNTTRSIESMAAMRLSLAINSSMRNQFKKEADVSGGDDFHPWLTAHSGNDYSAGEIKVIQPDSELDSGSVEVTQATTNYELFTNNIKTFQTDTTERINNVVYSYPSRIIQSYPNYPELFDNPEIEIDLNSFSVRDINPADGQDITATIPFFGESTFGGSQLNSSLVIFKSSSIYVYNTETKEYQKLDSRGLGCTAPHSVAASRNGIMFANESGIYRVNRDLSISYVGKYVERIWKDDINRDGLSEAVGHQYHLGRKYKISLPMGSDAKNSEVLVYSHDSEGGGTEYGSWTKYTNHQATGWANQDNDAFFGSISGDVYKVRNTGDKSDFRDDADAVAIKITTRGEDFGTPGKRKYVKRAFLEFQLDHTDISDLHVESRTNLRGVYTSAGDITAKQADGEYIPVRLSLEEKKGVQIQLQLEHAEKDEEIVLTGIGWEVDGLQSTGISEQADYDK